MTTHRVALFAHRWSAPAPTGMGRHSHGLARGLAEVLDGDSGWEVTATAAAEPRPVLPAGIGWRPLPGPRKARLAAWRLARRPRIDGPLGRPDLVHSLLPFVPVPTRAPFVLTVPDTIPIRHPEWYRWFERWGFAGGYGQLLDADAVVVSSRHTAEEVVELGVDPKLVATVPLGVDEEFYDEVDPSTLAAAARRFGVEPGRFLVSVGRVSARKNATALLEALASLPPTGGVELLLVGPAGDENVRATAARLGLGARVRTTGFVGDDELRALLQGALALLHPSSEEGFGLPPLEAMASGTPAAVARSSSLPEVVGDAAVLVDVDDPAAWASVIDRLRNDPGWVLELVTAGRAHAAEHRWAATARGHLDVWSAVLDGATSPDQRSSAAR